MNAKGALLAQHLFHGLLNLAKLEVRKTRLVFGEADIGSCRNRLHPPRRSRSAAPASGKHRSAPRNQSSRGYVSPNRRFRSSYTARGDGDETGILPGGGKDDVGGFLSRDVTYVGVPATGNQHLADLLPLFPYPGCQ